MPSPLNIKNQDFSFLGKGSTLCGEFVLGGTTHLQSKVEGKITMSNDSNLVIEFDAVVKGELNGSNIEIYGQFEGNINSTGKVIIYPPAKVRGNIQAKSLEIHPGAQVNFDAHTLEQ